MTFLEPALLFFAPLVALPVVIHLIHLFRRKPIHWAAMMFLQMAQRMNKGLSRLRQILILACRVMALAGLLFVICRPLAGGWLGLTGGAPNTVILLLDRSASMEQHPATATMSKRQTALRNVSKAIRDAVGTRSRLVLIDSATLAPIVLEKPETLLDLPQTEATDTAADIPLLMNTALEYVAANKTGRTDVWLVSDLQKTDWDHGSPRWETLRRNFSAQQGIRFHVLTYAQPPAEDFAIRVEKAQLRQTISDAKLLLDLVLSRNGENLEPVEVPVRCVVNGLGSTLRLTVKDARLEVRGLEIPVERSLTRGWGRVELPSDSNTSNDSFSFVFDQQPPLRSAVVSDDAEEAAPLIAALSAAADPSRNYTASLFNTPRAHEIPWEETGLLVWHAPIPKTDDPLMSFLREHAQKGRSIVFLPPNTPDENEAWGLRWDQWQTFPEAQSPNSWRNDTDLLANTQDGNALALGNLEIRRLCSIAGQGLVLAQLAGQVPLLVRAPEQKGVYFLGTLPGSGSSSLAREGIALFAMLHRALAAGAQSLGYAQFAECGAHALPERPDPWKRVDTSRDASSTDLSAGLHAGVVESGRHQVALNRPQAEDSWVYLSATTVNELFAGLDFRLLSDSVEEGKDLTSEIWRTFLFAMALSLIGEALLCLPPRTPESMDVTGRLSGRPVS